MDDAVEEAEGAEGTGTRGWRAADAVRCAACRPSASGAPWWGGGLVVGVLCEPLCGGWVGVAQLSYIFGVQALAQAQQAPSLWLG